MSKSEKWINEKLEQIPSTYRHLAETILRPLLSKLQNRLKLFSSLPDLRWYVVDRSFESTRKLIIDFLEDTIGNTLNPISTVEGKGARMVLSKIMKIPKVTKNMKQSILYELDFIEYSARHNIQDVKAVFDELYDNRIFRF